ncbi:Tat pathway signal sequence domain protein [Cellulomonas sp. S1-8]|uniref:Tat pathway signal sequence domain protein n=1 Tax=Cellulomonas sp. S1-8 TaxID=2904790 RepID=UPI002243A636|nr:Tat pathway signal sequence domain protein [Cellulomonas sp. S1-8]UZN03426.1 Tat pathway signal sequence domain protein [Cellulomonas sp. S1-8]
MPDDPQIHATTRHALGRRTFLALTGATAAVVAGAGAAAAHDGRSWGPRPVVRPGPGHHHGGRAGAERAAVAFVRAAADAYPTINTGPRLAQSYTDELGLFSTAFVYDNALAICALLGDGRRSSVDSARIIGDGLVFAQDHDPDHADGRLRQGYNVGPYVFYDGNPQPDGFVRADGYANIGWQFGFLGTAVGDMAWPGIALLQLFRATRDPRYLDAARRIGEWITTNTWSTAPLGGFSFGVDGGNVPVPNGSTEHNVDCVAFFTMLRKATGDRRWTDAAEHALAFVDLMWEPRSSWFWTGTNDGVEINRDPVPLDPATWSRLAIRERRYDGALDWAATALAVTDDAADATSQLPDDARLSGVTFSSASLTSTAQYNGVTVHPQGVWLEGTAQLATSLLDRDRRGDRQQAESLLQQVRRAQDMLGGGQNLGGNPVSGGVVAASSLLDSGFGFGYFQVQHVGATSWFLLASTHSNPMRWGGLR